MLPETGSGVSPSSQLTVDSWAAARPAWLPSWSLFSSQSMAAWGQALKMPTLKECIA